MGDTEKDKSSPLPLAVALRYEHGKDSAPYVIAKGRGVIAEKIVATAEEHGIAVENNAFLAEALSRVELDQQIPRELYRAVAEVIGFVMRLSGPTSAMRK